MIKLKANEGIKILCLLYFFAFENGLQNKNEVKIVQIQRRKTGDAQG